MKWKSVVLDAATVAGCCIGVGFLSGKEAQMYFGNVANVAIFAVVFAAVNCLVREFCRMHNCPNATRLLQCCFGKWAGVFILMFLMCCFVCVVTMLAGVENCLRSFLGGWPLPMYAMLCAGIAALVLKKGLKALQVLNVLSIALTLAYIVTFALCEKHVAPQTDISPLQPMKYALFSVTMSVGVLAPLAQTSAKNNTCATSLSTAIISLLIVFVLKVGNYNAPLPLFGQNLVLNIFGGVAATLATVTGVVANTVPLLQNLQDIFEDDSLCIACVLCLAVAFSMLGFDFALHYGYVFVASVGLVLTAVVATKTLCKRKRRPAIC